MPLSLGQHTLSLLGNKEKGKKEFRKGEKEKD
jgi:hypothetical protein